MIWRGEQAGRAVGGTGIEFWPRTIPPTAVREATEGQELWNWRVEQAGNRWILDYTGHWSKGGATKCELRKSDGLSEEGSRKICNGVLTFDNALQGSERGAKKG